jgi:hypothetical protein
MKPVCAHGVEKTKCDFCQLKQEPDRLSRTDDFVMIHANELQAILDYVEDMEQRISIVREQLQYLVTL